MRNEANTHRAARTAKLAQVGQAVTYLTPVGKKQGTITRTTAASVFVTFPAQLGHGGVTFRFSQRLDGDYRRSGTGQYAPALIFPLALELREQAILAHPANQAPVTN